MGVRGTVVLRPLLFFFSFTLEALKSCVSIIFHEQSQRVFLIKFRFLKNIRHNIYSNTHPRTDRTRSNIVSKTVIDHFFLFFFFQYEQTKRQSENKYRTIIQNVYKAQSTVSNSRTRQENASTLHLILMTEIVKDRWHGVSGFTSVVRIYLLSCAAARHAKRRTAKRVKDEPVN